MARACLLLPMAIFGACVLAAQQPPPDFPHWNHEMAQGPPPPMGPNRPPLHGPRGRWWTDPALIQKLGLTADQQKRIDGLFQQSRLKLIDLSAGLQKQEAILEPLLAADRPDEGQVLAQIDRIAQARAELEKANARMLLGFRGVLTLDQWKRLEAEEPPRRGEHP
jgi:protein CpxP